MNANITARVDLIIMRTYFVNNIFYACCNTSSLSEEYGMTCFTERIAANIMWIKL